MCPAQFIPLYLGTESRVNKGIATLKKAVPIQIVMFLYIAMQKTSLPVPVF